MARAWTLLRRLRSETSGVALTEMAMAMPFLLMTGLWGVELANYAIATMRVNQLAAQMADNASRIGDNSMLEDRKIYESDINDLLVGGNVEAGTLDFFEHGRAIISSLEVYPGTTDRQYIHWQRCMGKKVWNSSYGDAGDGADGSLAGMGPSGEEVIAFNNEAVMFVEVAYDYQPMVSARFVGTPNIRSIASFTVRSDRDLSQIYQRDPAHPDPVAGCATFSNPYAPPAGGGGSSGGASSGGASSGGGGASSGGGGHP